MFNYGVPITRKQIKRSNLLALCFVPQACNFIAGVINYRLWHRCFLVNFSKFLRTPFLQNTSELLLLCFDWSHTHKLVHQKNQNLVLHT